MPAKFSQSEEVESGLIMYFNSSKKKEYIYIAIYINTNLYSIYY
jgi:hypothetical protein